MDAISKLWDNRGRDATLHALLVALLILSLLPFAITINLSFKNIPQFEHERWVIQGPFHWENYLEAWRVVKVYITNSILTSGLAAVGVVFLSAASGYAFARGQFPFKESLFLFIIAGLMIPGILYLVPKFVLYKSFHLVDTRWSLWVSYWTEGQIFGIFLFRSYFEGLPNDFFEAAEMDGANIWQCFRHIAMPLGKPIVGTLAVINVMFTWNDIIWPWIAISKDSLRTISIGLSVFQGQNLENWGPMFAGYTIAALPLIVLFVFTRKWFIEGLVSGAFKA